MVSPPDSAVKHKDLAGGFEKMVNVAERKESDTACCGLCPHRDSTACGVAAGTQCALIVALCARGQRVLPGGCWNKFSM